MRRSLVPWPALKRHGSKDLSHAQLVSLRALFAEAWKGDEAFSDDDWKNAMGGLHFFIEEQKEILAHASVVERRLLAGEALLRAGYVEAVATRAAHRGRGLGSVIMDAVGRYIDDTFELGALDTGIPGYFTRFGWRKWEGPTFVRSADGIERTPEEDGLVMIRFTPSSPGGIGLSGPISCEWRPGDVW